MCLRILLDEEHLVGSDALTFYSLKLFDTCDNLIGHLWDIAQWKMLLGYS